MRIRQVGVFSLICRLHFRGRFVVVALVGKRWQDLEIALRRYKSFVSSMRPRRYEMKSFELYPRTWQWHSISRLAPGPKLASLASLRSARSAGP